MKLSEAQRKALSHLSSVQGSSAYRMKVGLNTLNALSLRGLVKMDREIGNMAFPHNAIWRITPAGRAALEDEADTRGPSV